MSTHAVDRAGISRNHEIINPHIRRTPILRIAAGDLGADIGDLVLKLELFQHTGSFKARGALTNVMTRNIPSAGVVAASGGNHGAAVAFAAKRVGVSAKIFVPSIASPAKIARIESYGADLVVGGERYADALAASEDWVASTGALPIHAFDEPQTLLGQGSVGLELEEQDSDLDTLPVAVGGGGLIGGIAAWYANKIKVVAVEPRTAPTLHSALEAGEPVDAPAEGIAADSLAPRRVGSLMFPIARDFVDHVVLVEDTAIAKAQQTLWDATRVVAEPGGAASLAAILSGAYAPAPDERVGVLICGGNTVAVRFDA